ncbi:MAG: Kdo hydroxylase family protein [Gammaproteobacteria bacterium]|nr:Kdo hydroxylase family protein [Gammaproteobacteria bacterium]
MLNPLYTLDVEDISQATACDSQHTTQQLESGHILYAPKLNFELTESEQSLLHPDICDTKKKNISYQYQKQQLGGVSTYHPQQAEIQAMMHRYALFAKMWVDALLPDYNTALRWGRTSYRPAEVSGRQRSKRQDDTRLHVDAFPATPVQGWRILRVFCNINPDNKPRVWHSGEPFADLLNRFAPRLAPYHALNAKVLHWLKATKVLRSAYDHYMLQLHDRMKLDDAYQASVEKSKIEFPANSTWMVFTDHVSHAALSGQYLLEQTFYLPVTAMLDQAHSPLRQIEKTLLQVEESAAISA